MNIARIGYLFCLCRNIAALVGAGWILKVAIKELYRLAGGFRAYFLAPWGIVRVDLKAYGTWAGTYVYVF